MRGGLGAGPAWAIRSKNALMPACLSLSGIIRDGLFEREVVMRVVTCSLENR